MYPIEAADLSVPVCVPRHSWLAVSVKRLSVAEAFPTGIHPLWANVNPPSPILKYPLSSQNAD